MFIVLKFNDNPINSLINTDNIISVEWTEYNLPPSKIVFINKYFVRDIKSPNYKEIEKLLIPR